EEVAFQILYQWIRAAFVFLIMLWDGAPLAVFGIRKRAWSMDIVTAVIALLAHETFAFMAVSLFADFLTSLNYKLPSHHRIFRFSEFQHSCTGVLLLLVLALSIGLGEELLMRGYLIPRLERIVKSKVWAIVISSMFFGCWHMPSGIVAVWSAFW